MHEGINLFLGVKQIKEEDDEKSHSDNDEDDKLSCAIKLFTIDYGNKNLRSLEDAENIVDERGDPESIVDEEYG